MLVKLQCYEPAPVQCLKNGFNGYFIGDRNQTGNRVTQQYRLICPSSHMPIVNRLERKETARPMTKPGERATTSPCRAVQRPLPSKQFSRLHMSNWLDLDLSQLQEPSAQPQQSADDDMSLTWLPLITMTHEEGWEDLLRLVGEVDIMPLLRRFLPLF